MGLNTWQSSPLVRGSEFEPPDFDVEEVLTHFGIWSTILHERTKMQHGRRHSKYRKSSDLTISEENDECYCRIGTVWVDGGGT